MPEKITVETFKSYLKPRERDWHKGLSGHVLVVGGDYGFFGAPRMAAEAALRVGAGLVSVATRPDNALTLNIGCPEIMCHGIEAADELAKLVEKADVIVLGPGLGQTAWAKALWSYVFATDKPLLVDADGLNILAQEKKQRANWVLTPHPGEAARLLGVTAAAIQQDRLAAAQQICERYDGVCVLKGAGSLITMVDRVPAICEEGNPGMASAGLGDVLSGVIGGLMAQRIPLDIAAKLGVCLHAAAGDMAAKEGERGLLATDLMPYLHRLCN